MSQTPYEQPADAPDEAPADIELIRSPLPLVIGIIAVAVLVMFGFVVLNYAEAPPAAPPPPSNPTPNP